MVLAPLGATKPTAVVLPPVPAVKVVLAPPARVKVWVEIPTLKVLVGVMVLVVSVPIVAPLVTVKAVPAPLNRLAAAVKVLAWLK